MTAQKLSQFQGYTIDVHLKEFRKVKNNRIKFIPFKSVEGKLILAKYFSQKKINDKQTIEILNYLIYS